MSRILSGKVLRADIKDESSNAFSWSQFYRRFDYAGSENILRDLAALTSLIFFQTFLVLACWFCSGWIVLWRLGQ